jgi:hypothetical protein
MIRGDLFWARGTDCIIDVPRRRCQVEPVQSPRQSASKRRNIILMPRATRTSALFSACGAGGINGGWTPRGKVANILMKKLSALLPNKWEKSYSGVCGYVNADHCLPSSEPQPISVSPRVSYSDEQNERPQRPPRRSIGRTRSRTSTRGPVPS